MIIEIVTIELEHYITVNQSLTFLHISYRTTNLTITSDKQAPENSNPANPIRPILTAQS